MYVSNLLLIALLFSLVVIFRNHEFRSLGLSVRNWFILHLLAVQSHLARSAAARYSMRGRRRGIGDRCLNDVTLRSATNEIERVTSPPAVRQRLESVLRRRKSSRRHRPQPPDFRGRHGIRAVGRILQTRRDHHHPSTHHGARTLDPHRAPPAAEKRCLPRTQRHQHLLR